jgi:hypothetical protein
MDKKSFTPLNAKSFGTNIAKPQSIAESARVPSCTGKCAGESDGCTGTTTVASGSGTGNYVSAAFDSYSGKVIVAYGGTSNGGSAAVGTVSGTSISFTSPVSILSGTIYSIDVVHDSNTHKNVIFWTPESSSYKSLVTSVLNGALAFY